MSQLTSRFLVWMVWHIMEPETHSLNSKILEGKDSILLVLCCILWAQCFAQSYKSKHLYYAYHIPSTILRTSLV